MADARNLAQNLESRFKGSRLAAVAAECLELFRRADRLQRAAQLAYDESVGAYADADESGEQPYLRAEEMLGHRAWQLRGQAIACLNRELATLPIEARYNVLSIACGLGGVLDDALPKAETVPAL
jgi:hypothetical protein